MTALRKALSFVVFTLVSLLMLNAPLLAWPPSGGGDDDEFIDDISDGLGGGGGSLVLTIPELLETAIFGGLGLDDADAMLELETALEKDDYEAVKTWLDRFKVGTFEAFKKKWRAQRQTEPLAHDDADVVENFYMVLEIVEAQKTGQTKGKGPDLSLTQFSTVSSAGKGIEDIEIDADILKRIQESILGGSSKSDACPKIVGKAKKTAKEKTGKTLKKSKASKKD